MNTRTMNARKAPIIPGTVPRGEATLIPIPYSVASLPIKPFAIPGALQFFPAISGLRAGCWDPYVLAVDPAIYWTEAWLSAAVFVQNRVMEICEDLCSVEPEVAAGFRLSSELFTHGVEQTVKLFGLWIPKAPCKPAPIVREMFELEEEALKEAIEVETEALGRAMDIATGETSSWERRRAGREGSRQPAKRLPRSAHTAGRTLRGAV